MTATVHFLNASRIHDANVFHALYGHTPEIRQAAIDCLMSENDPRNIRIISEARNRLWSGPHSETRRLNHVELRTIMPDMAQMPPPPIEFAGVYWPAAIIWSLVVVAAALVATFVGIEIGRALMRLWLGLVEVVAMAENLKGM